MTKTCKRIYFSYLFKQSCAFVTTSAKAAKQLCFKHDALSLTHSALTIVHIDSNKYNCNHEKFVICNIRLKISTHVGFFEVQDLTTRRTPMWHVTIVQKLYKNALYSTD